MRNSHIRRARVLAAAAGICLALYAGASPAAANPLPDSPPSISAPSSDPSSDESDDSSSSPDDSTGSSASAAGGASAEEDSADGSTDADAVETPEPSGQGTHEDQPTGSDADDGAASSGSTGSEPGGSEIDSPTDMDLPGTDGPPVDEPSWAEEGSSGDRGNPADSAEVTDSVEPALLPPGPDESEPVESAEPYSQFRAPGDAPADGVNEPGPVNKHAAAATLEAEVNGGTASIASSTLAPTTFTSPTMGPLSRSTLTFTFPTFNLQNVFAGFTFFSLPLLGAGTPAPVNPFPLAILAWVRRTQQVFDNKTPTVGASTSVYDATSGTVRGLLGISDADGDRLAYTVTDAPDRGTVIINSDGTYIYTPNSATAEAGGTDTFTVRASDNTGFHFHGLASLFGLNRHTATASVTVAVPADPNEDPVRNPNSLPQVGAPDPLTGVVTGSVAGIVTDPDGDPIRYSSADPLVTVDASTGAFTFTPTPDVRHQAAFPGASPTRPVVISVSDGRGGSVDVAFEVGISSTNQTPMATGQLPSFVVDPVSGSVAGSLAGTVTDGDGDPLVFGSSTGLSTKGGTVVVTESGGFVYTPTAPSLYDASDPNASDDATSDTFTVTVTDGVGQPTSVTVVVPIETFGPTVSVAGEPTIYSSPVVDRNGTAHVITQDPSGDYYVTSVDSDGTVTRVVLLGEPSHPMLDEQGSIIIRTRKYLPERSTYEYHLTVIRGDHSHSATLSGMPDSANPLVVDASGTVFQITNPGFLPGFRVTAVNATGSTTVELPGAPYDGNVVVNGVGTGFVLSYTVLGGGSGGGSTRPTSYVNSLTVISAEGSSDIDLPDGPRQIPVLGSLVTAADGTSYLFSYEDATDYYGTKLLAISSDGATVTTVPIEGGASGIVVSGNTAYVTAGGPTAGQSRIIAVTGGVASTFAVLPGNVVGGALLSPDNTTLYQLVILPDSSRAVLRIREGEVTQMGSGQSGAATPVAVTEDGTVYLIGTTFVDSVEGPQYTTTLTTITDAGITTQYVVEGLSNGQLTTFDGGAFVRTLAGSPPDQVYRVLAVRGTDSLLVGSPLSPKTDILVGGDNGYYFEGYDEDLVAVDADGSTTTVLGGTRYGALVVTEDRAFQLVRNGTFGNSTGALLVVSPSDTTRIELLGSPFEMVSIGSDVYVVSVDQAASKTYLTVVTADGPTVHTLDGLPGGFVLTTADGLYVTTVSGPGTTPTSAEQFTTTVRAYVGAELVGTTVLPGNTSGGAIAGADGTIRQTVITGDPVGGFVTRTVTISPSSTAGATALVDL